MSPAPSSAARPAGAPQQATRRDAGAGESTGPWPHGVSRAASMSIGALVGQLKAEFPAVTISKVRFLEEQGLVTPTRTGSGYRKYSPADVERLRYALTRQRDHYLPLRVIREELEDLDAGRVTPPQPLARVIARDGRLVLPGPTERIALAELCELTGATETEVEELAQAGLVVPDTRGRFVGRSVAVVTAALALGRFGLSPRHLRTVRMSAEREADTIDTVVAPLRAKRTGSGRERGAAQAAELAQLYADLHAELLRAAVDQLD